MIQEDTGFRFQVLGCRLRVPDIL